MNIKALRAELKKKHDRFKELRSKESLTDEEKTEKSEIRARCEALISEIDDIEADERLLDSMDDQTIITPGSHSVVNEPPIYRSFGEQLKDIVTMGKPMASGRTEARERLSKAEKRMAMERTNDPALEKEMRAAGDGQIAGIGELGGAFVQTDFATDIIHRGFNNSVILPKTQRRTLSGNSNSVEIYGIDETSRASGSRNGGVVVYTKAELEAYEESKAKFNAIEIKVNKLTGLLYLSDEVLEDVSFLEGEVSSLFQEEFAFKTQDLVMHGSGAGEPLGLINASALISIAKESGQGADTIMVENIDKMLARISGGGAEFYANRDISPQLKNLYRHVDTNKVEPVFKPMGINGGTIDGVPVTFLEQSPTLGDLGDLMLVDWGAYLTATKGGLKKAESMHLKFDYGQKCIRWTMRFDGQPRWSSAITPYKGSATVSPFVAIAARE